MNPRERVRLALINTIRETAYESVASFDDAARAD